MSDRVYRLVVGGIVACALAGTLVARARRPRPEPRPPAPASARALPRVIEVGGDDCAACKAMAVVLARLRRDHAGRLTVERVGSWERPDEARRLRVKMSPTVILYDAQGREVWRTEGYVGDQAILAAFRRHGVTL